MTDASQINPEKFGSNFPNSHLIVKGDKLEVSRIEEFISEKKKLKGVKLTLKDGSFAHTTAKQPVGYILSPKTGLNQLIADSPDKAVNLYFGESPANIPPYTPMLRCSIYQNAV